MAKEYSFDEIEEYLDGTFSPEQKIAFEQQLKNDPALAEAVDKHRLTHHITSHYARTKLKEKVKSIHQQVNEKSGSTQKNNWLRIAASLLIVAVAGFSYIYLGNQYSNEQLFNSSFEPYPNRFKDMSEGDDHVLSKALDKYDRKQYQEAIDLLKNIPPESEHFTAAQLYTGIAYLASDNPEQSIDPLRAVENRNTVYAETARWYLALAYITIHDEANAKALLEKIVHDKSYQSGKAEEIVRKLNSPVRSLPGI